MMQWQPTAVESIQTQAGVESSGNVLTLLLGMNPAAFRRLSFGHLWIGDWTFAAVLLQS